MKFLGSVAAGIAAIFLATKFVPGVSLQIIEGQSSFLGFKITQWWQLLVLIGFLLGIINFFIKPILDKITLPLKILTLGIFAILLDMAVIKCLDILFLEFKISGLIPLFWTTIIVWLINLLLRVK